MMAKSQSAVGKLNRHLLHPTEVFPSTNPLQIEPIKPKKNVYQFPHDQTIKFAHFPR
jgi:hypothetical protein